MPEMTRGLHITQYMEDCFSMSSITIKFIDSEVNEGEDKISDNVFQAIGRLLYIYIRKSEYYKESEFIDYMESPKYGEISFCLTPACGEKEILRFVQDLFLDILGINLRKKNIIETVGAENIPKMEEELAEAKAIVKDLLLDITMKRLVSVNTEWRC
jgi:hypothetical protein